MGKMTFRAVLLLCFVSLMLVACAREPDEPDRGQTDATPERGGGEEAKVRTIPEEGTLPRETYSTGAEFEPSFSFEFGEGWRVLPASEGNALRLGYITPGRDVAEGKALRFLNVREVFEPHEEDGEVSFEARPVPEDLVGWFRRHRYLSTDEPEPVDIGGISGKQFDAGVNVPEGYRGGGCAVPCIPLLRLGDGSVTRMTEGGKNRFAVLADVRGETVIIIASAPLVEFDEFLPKAQKVLDTVEWKDA